MGNVNVIVEYEASSKKRRLEMWLFFRRWRGEFDEAEKKIKRSAHGSILENDARQV